MLLLLFLMMIAAVGSANAVSIVGVGKHIVKPDGTVKLTDRWNVAASGTQPRGYKMYGCPIEIKANGDITAIYTKSGGGKNGCGLDLVAKKPVDDTIRFTIAITANEPNNTCVNEKNAGYNMLPFIHSVDNQEFQRMSKGGGWFGSDKGNCSKNADAEKCKNKEGKYQCRNYTTYEFGWSMKGEELRAVVKPVAEPKATVDRTDTNTKARNYLKLFVPFRPLTLIVTSKELQVEGANINDTEIRSQFVCTPQPDAKLYPVISWTIANGEETSLNGRHLLFFGLLAQDTKRDYFMNHKEGLPLCNLSLTFKGEDYELLHQQEFIPTQTIPTTNQTEQTTDYVINTIDTTTSPSSAPADNMLLGILLGVGGVLTIMAIGGVLIYCMCFKNRKDGDESDDDKSEESETDEESSARTSNGIQSQTEEEDEAATAYGQSATTAYGPTAVIVPVEYDKKKATTVDKDNSQKNQSLDGSKGVSVPSTYYNN